MVGFPTTRVYLDDGSGSFPFDVTPYVHLPSGWSVRRGRQDEFSTVEASQLTLRLDNTDGRFTLGSPTYGIRVDQRIRVVETVGATASQRFTGYVEAWPTQWPSPSGAYAVANVTAIDRQARLARRKMRSMLENEIMVDLPTAYYSLTEAAGASSAGDTSGVGGPPLRPRGSGASVAFGASGPVGGEGLTAVAFAGGQHLAWSEAGPNYYRTSGVVVDAFFATTSAAGGTIVRLPSTGTNASQVMVTIDPLGHVGVNVTPPGAGTPGSVFASVASNDGAWHHACAVVTATNVSLYVDGVLAGSNGFTPSSPGVDAAQIRVGEGFTGSIAHVALDTSLSATRIAARAFAGISGAAGERSDQRIARFAQYGNIPTAEQALETGTLTNVPAQAVTDSQAIDAMRAVELAEGGSVFVDGSGSLVFQNRQHRVAKATGTPALAVSSADVDHGNLVITGDKQLLKNYVEGSRNGGATQLVSDQTSINAYEQYPDSGLSSMLVTTDDEVLDAISWRCKAYAQPLSRMSSVTIDLLTQTTAVQQAVLALTLGDRMTISGLPSQSPMSTADLLIEGWEEAQSDQEWRITFNTSPAATSQAWVLGDTTFGVLGSTTKLYY